MPKPHKTKKKPSKPKPQKKQHRICEHNKRKSRCIECGGGSICEHKKIRSMCIECGGGSICEHNKRRTECIECGGLPILAQCNSDPAASTIQRGVAVVASAAGGASTGEWLQQLDKEGGGLPWLSLHTMEFRSCVYLLFALPVRFSVHLPALPKSANAGDSDPLTCCRCTAVRTQRTERADWHTLRAR